MPQSLKGNQEAIQQTRGGIWRSSAQTYITKNCDEKGIQNGGDTLTPQEAAGLKSLQKRVKDGEIVLQSSDKGKKLTVSSMESYRRQGMVHVGKDKEVTWTEAMGHQTTCSSHGQALCNIMNVGEWAGGGGGEGGARRAWENVGGTACSIPPLKVLPKTHKDLEENGDPKTRPVVSSAAGMTSRAGNMIADIIVGVTRAGEGSMKMGREGPSTEVVLS